jgi:hypothetical protein
MGVVLLAGWLGVSASARAQYPVSAAASGDLPPHAFDDVPQKGTPNPAPAASPAPAGQQACPPLVPMSAVDGPMPHSEIVPSNGFSNVHPDQVTVSPHFYIGADYLLWWVRKDQVPALATAGSLADDVPGALGQPGTKNLLGNGSFGAPSSSGARVTLFYWCDNDHNFGFDATGFWLDDAQRSASVGGSGDPNGSTVVARPFYNVNANTQDADPIAVPGVQMGGLLVRETRRFWGADANLRCSECVDCTPISRVTFLAGVRYLRLDEGLQFSETTNDLPDSDGNPGNSMVLHDNFLTYNQFYGAQVGLETETRVGHMVFLLNSKVAFGQTHQVVKTGANTTVTEPDGTVVFDPTRGLLVQPSNLGRFTHNRFGVVPELAATLAWEFNDHVRVSVGYNFLWWNSVVRPGEQIDTHVNVGAVGDVGQLGSIQRPAVLFGHTDFWAQGFSAGLQVSF